MLLHKYYLSVLMVTAALLIPGSWQAPLATPAEVESLNKAFINLCEEFQTNLQPGLFSERKNCSALWTRFQSEAVSTNSCRLQNEENLDRLMQLGDHSLPANKSMFWSGTYNLAAKVRNLPDYYTLEKTLLGYVIDSLNDRLGQVTSCKNVTMPFWVASSKWFASKAQGRVSVILNASLSTPFRKSSIFGGDELPILLSSSRVSSMQIYLVNSLRDGINTSGSCESESVQDLKRQLTNNNISVSCTENPDFLVRSLCDSEPGAERCRTLGANSLRPTSLLWMATAFLFCVFARAL